MLFGDGGKDLVLGRLKREQVCQLKENHIYFYTETTFYQLDKKSGHFWNKKNKL